MPSCGTNNATLHNLTLSATMGIVIVFDERRELKGKEQERMKNKEDRKG
jgi:hypothetical protein